MFFFIIIIKHQTRGSPKWNDGGSSEIICVWEPPHTPPPSSLTPTSSKNED